VINSSRNIWEVFILKRFHKKCCFSWFFYYKVKAYIWIWSCFCLFQGPGGNKAPIPAPFSPTFHRELRILASFFQIGDIRLLQCFELTCKGFQLFPARNFQVENLGVFESIFETASEHEPRDKLATFGEITLDIKISRYCPIKAAKMIRSLFLVLESSWQIIFTALICNFTCSE
jgi:hypothetical protein